MQPSRLRMTLGDSLLLGVLAFSVLWKGGKSLDIAWLLGIAAVLLVLCALKTLTVSRKALIAGFAFLGLSVLSYCFSQAKNYGLDELLRDSACFLVFCWTASRCALPDDLTDFRRKFLKALTWAAVIACFIGLAVYVFEPVSRFVGTFFDIRFHTDFWPNAWAEFLLLVWPLSVFALRRRPVVLGLILALFLGCLLLSYSRAGLLALFAQLALLLLLGGIPALFSRSWPRGETVLHWGKVFILLAGSALLLFIAANDARSRFFTVESVTNKATFTAAEGTSSVSERREFWNAAIAMTKEKPLLGWGPYSFRFVQPQYQSSVLATSDHPHNLLLKIGSERGVFAMIAYILVLVFAVGPALIGVLKGQAKAKRDLWTPLALTSIAGVLTHTLVDYNLQFIAIALPFWIVLGMLVPSEQRSFAAGKIILKAIAALLFVVLLIEGFFLTTSSLGRHAQAAGDNAKAIYWYNLSSPELFSRDLWLSLSALHLEREETEEAMKAAMTSLQKNPHDARAWLFLGNLQESIGDTGQALLSYEQSWVLGRYNVLNALSGLLRVSLEREDTTSLEARREDYLALFRDYANAIKQNTHFIALSATVEELQHVSGLLVSAYPGFTSEIRTLTNEASANALEERERFSQKKAGMLW